MMDLTDYHPKLHKNEEHGGLELTFSSRPPQEVLDQLKENGFRWHYKNQLWFAKATTERLDFASRLVGTDDLSVQSEAPLQSSEIGYFPDVEANVSPIIVQKDKSANTFASVYDCIGDVKILPALEGSLHSRMEAFFEKENLYFRRTFGADHITFLELQNAQKTGTSCKEWHIYPVFGSVATLSSLLSQNDIEDLNDLWSFCRSGKSIDGITISTQEHKGVDIFSPFVEVKPLKELPEKWTKRNFTQALMSGQLYRGDVAYRYTDDYAYDAAVGFRTGVGLNMPSFAKKAVGDWGVSTSCRNQSDERDEYGGSAVSYSEHINSSKTLWFDKNCDIAEGKRCADERIRSIEEHNYKLEESCIHVRPSSINPDKCYSITTIDKQTNSGLYEKKYELLQGSVLQELLNPEYVQPDILHLKEMEIEQTRFYVIADFFHRRDHAEDDERIVGCGNWKQIVTGKALMELTQEGVTFPVLLDNDPEYSSYASAYQHLLAQASGRSRFMFSKNQDFTVSLERLMREHRRAGQRGLEDLIKGAGERQHAPDPSAPTPEHMR